ncbi:MULTISPECIES: nuclear transport factor 2 family protein [Enemella]|uniref:SnoaL-like domain-containing protein n=1 Tax=Enemella dayhoffiae TaxID=2016507 RepID=A0A255GU82_9ACTN|nr:MULTISPECIES: nuclear transport factor 2 family protein [Enemella]OYO19269.1 hypothetical protein CGZ93_12850 [Enemella dayhoffiae]TDO93304.1 SnoaL-like protein [Enemella evansiae]
MTTVERRLRVLEAKEAIRTCLGRYLDLCDVPGPFPDVAELAELAELFTPRATWRGVGEAYAGKFGSVTGRHKVAAHVASYLPPAEHFRRNAHLLGSEQLRTDGSTGHGQWLMQQLSEYADGTADLLCARLNIDFVVQYDDDGTTALIHRFQTERLFRASLHTRSDG